MKLYHSGSGLLLILTVSNLLGMLGCTAPRISDEQIALTILVDGNELAVTVPAGSTVDEVLRAAGVIMGSLDRSDPPVYTVLSQNTRIRVIRMKEEFVVEQEAIPFENQIVQNESLPAGQELWLQLGENGLREITIRRVYEDGVEVSSSPVRSVVIKEPIPQIKMVGVQKAFVPITIPGRLVYLADGNAWVMEESTTNRRQITTTGDLDGRVFSLSPDERWLLYTRSSSADEEINHLWAEPLNGRGEEAIDLGVADIVHFADWKPDATLTLAYSTVEPRSGAPGWQANNDLRLLTFSGTGFIRELPALLDANSGGIYGWWGTDFSWSADGSVLAYSRPDEVGILDGQSGEMTPLLELPPVQTFGDWAWTPGIGWDPNGEFLFLVNHRPPGESLTFDLVAIDLALGELVTLRQNVGMFAHPVMSPVKDLPTGEKAYQVAYLQAIFPDQSETSRYRLSLMDRDGSNNRILFPTEGMGGLEPQEVVWSPRVMPESGHYAIALIYENNLWLIDSETGEARQITGDSLTTRIDWK